MEHAVDAGLLDQPVGDHLEAFGVDLVRHRLALGHRGTHLEGSRLELATDAVGLDRLLVPVPRHALDADGGDVAAEATEAFDKGDVDAGPRGGKRRGESGRAGTDDQNIGLVDDIDLSSGFGDAAERAAAGGSGHGEYVSLSWSSRRR